MTFLIHSFQTMTDSQADMSTIWEKQQGTAPKNSNFENMYTYKLQNSLTLNGIVSLSNTTFIKAFIIT